MYSSDSSLHSVVVEHMQVNRAPTMHAGLKQSSWPNQLSMSSPCRTEMILIEKEQIVSKLEEEVAQKKNTSQMKVKRQKLMTWK